MASRYPHQHLGLSQPLLQALTALLGTPITACDANQLGQQEETVLFVAASAWDGLQLSARQAIERCGAALILVADTTPERTLELFANGRFVAVLPLPLTPEKIAALHVHLEEMFQVRSDMRAMAREIALERELLVRKNEELAFLNDVLRRTSTCLHVDRVLTAYLDAVTTLVSVRQAAAVFWEATDSGLEADFLLPPGPAELQERWINHLSHVMQRYGAGTAQAFRRTILPWGQALAGPPEAAELLTQPLQVEKEIFGALVLCTEGADRLGRDRLHILQAATNHAALALRNALHFRRVKSLADHDGLTRIANRQAFDARLREEMKRHQRHGHHLSVLLLDLDFFKSINDTYGHLTGDMVLCRVGDLLRHSLRESDFPARFGGEEFVVLLPQTDEEQAWALAERLRARIAKERFSFEGRQFRVTASIGVAGMRPGALTPPEVLLQEADQALYRAKNSGRNVVCVSSQTEAPSPAWVN